jgi:hypothetical protein
MTIACPSCGNSLHVETAAVDPPCADFTCKCPRCNKWFPVPGGEAGEPHADPTGWAIRANPVPDATPPAP